MPLAYFLCTRSTATNLPATSKLSDVFLDLPSAQNYCAKLFDELVKERGRCSNWLDAEKLPVGYFVEDDGHVYAASIREFPLSLLNGTSKKGYAVIEDSWKLPLPHGELCPTFTLQICHNYELVRQAAAIEAYYNVDIGYEPMHLTVTNDGGLPIWVVKKSNGTQVLVHVIVRQCPEPSEVSESKLGDHQVTEDVATDASAEYAVIKDEVVRKATAHKSTQTPAEDTRTPTM
jgi:hypothetical protein